MMSDCARCIHCCSEDVECTGARNYAEDEYYCHSCEKYFDIDWELQDEIEELQKDNGYEDEEKEDEDEEEQY
jgi:hypothetical protein